GGLQVVTGLRPVAEVHVGQPAPVDTLGIDVGHLLHLGELREAVDCLREERLLLLRVAHQLRRLVAHPGEMVRDDVGLDLGGPPARAAVELLKIAVRLGDLLAQAIEPGAQRLLLCREIAFQIGPHGARALAIAALKEIVEVPAALLERRRVRRPGRQRERSDQQKRAGAAEDHSEARAKPLAPASLARPSTRTTSPRTTWRSPARITTLSLVFASASFSTLASAPSSPATGRSFT